MFFRLDKYPKPNLTIGIGLSTPVVFFLCVVLTGFTSCSKAKDPPETLPRVAAVDIQLQPASTELTNDAFVVVGLYSEVIDQLSKSLPQDQAWTELFGVYITRRGQPLGENAIPMLGEYKIIDNQIRFTPRFPLEAEASYVARFDTSYLAGLIQGSFQLKPSSGVEEVFDFLPENFSGTGPPSASQLVAIYPSSETVPANLLKLYICFSAPMSRGNVYHHIHLVDSEGVEVKHPFLEVDEELWDKSQRRLTVLFDPGRIKKGLRPNKEVGPPLIPGKLYRLKIDQAWLDANGKPCLVDFQSV